jgi:4'-phosphopantetheinyl transferase
MIDAVQIWKIPLQVSEWTSARYFNCLSADEKIRAERFRFEQDRRRFVVARGSLRHLLSEQLHQAPERIKFGYGEYGKPCMKETFRTRPLAANVSDVSDVSDALTVSDTSNVSDALTEAANCTLPSLLPAAVDSMATDADFHFNLSHSGELALCALGYARPVGIDIEAVKPMNRLEGLMDLQRSLSQGNWPRADGLYASRGSRFAQQAAG